MAETANIEPLQAQKTAEALAAAKQTAVQQVLSVFDPWYASTPRDYLGLCRHLRTLLDAELASARPVAAPTEPEA